MFRKVLILNLVILFFSFLEAQAAVINSTWVGGSQGVWQDANNWNPNIVPDNNATNTFAVTIDAGSVGINIRQGWTIDQLDCYGEVVLQGWEWSQLTLVDVNGLTNHGELEIFYQVEIQGNVTNTIGAELYLEQTGIKGNLYNLAGGVIKFEQENDVEEGDLQNEGTIDIIHASDLFCEQQVRNYGTINLYSGELDVGGTGILENYGSGVIKGFGVIHATSLLQNEGQIIASGGSLTVLSEGSFLNTGVLCNKPLASLYIMPEEDVNNNGTIEVNAGGGMTFDCNLVNDTNGVIELLNGTLAATTITQTADADFSGFGGITGDAVINSNGIIELTGTTKIVGDVNISPDATLEISDGVTLVTGQTTCNGTIHIKGGYLIPQGGFSGDCNIIWEAGLFTNPADFNLDGEVNFGDFAYFAETWLWQTAWR